MLTIFAWIIGLPFIVLTATFGIEVLAGLRPAAPVRRAGLPESSVILMPAHNEVLGIERSVRSMLYALPSGARLIVIADNCDDMTADLARGVGAEVIERCDPARRGKGFALAFARDRLRADPPQVVSVVDADCEMDRASLTALITDARDLPAQAVNLLRGNLSAPTMVQVSTFAFAVKNLVRQRGLGRLAKRILLTGTGMAFPWTVFDDAALASDDLVEDLSLGLDLAAKDIRTIFVEDATVWSNPASASGTIKQRQRWEGGFIATSLARAVPAVLRAIGRADFRGVWAGLSLMVPPLALLVLIDVAMTAVLIMLSLFGASPLPAIVLIAMLIVATVGVALAWRQVGRAFLSPAAAASLPLYALWKIPLYLKLAQGKPKTWERTERD